MQEYKIVVQGTRKIITYLKSYLKIPYKLYYFPKQNADYFKKLNNTGFRSVNVNYLSTLTQEEITKFSIKNAGTIPVCFKD